LDWLHLKAAKLQRLRHKNANTENKYWLRLPLPFPPFGKLLNIIAVAIYERTFVFTTNTVILARDAGI
jgi:hypothetical protein